MTIGPFVEEQLGRFQAFISKTNHKKWLFRSFYRPTQAPNTMTDSGIYMHIRILTELKIASRDISAIQLSPSYMFLTLS